MSAYDTVLLDRVYPDELLRSNSPHAHAFRGLRSYAETLASTTTAIRRSHAVTVHVSVLDKQKGASTPSVVFASCTLTLSRLAACLCALARRRMHLINSSRRGQGPSLQSLFSSVQDKKRAALAEQHRQRWPRITSKKFPPPFSTIRRSFRFAQSGHFFPFTSSWTWKETLLVGFPSSLASLVTTRPLGTRSSRIQRRDSTYAYLQLFSSPRTSTYATCQQRAEARQSHLDVCSARRSPAQQRVMPRRKAFCIISCHSRVQGACRPRQTAAERA